MPHYRKDALNGASPATIRIYSKSWSAFKTHGKADFSDTGVKAFMLELISSGLKPGSANAYARSVNSFLTWLFENGHITTHLRVPLASIEKKVLQTYTIEDIHKIITHKPTSRTRKRLIAILFLLIDSGCRVNEALSDCERIVLGKTQTDSTARSGSESIRKGNRVYIESAGDIPLKLV